jgi:hypothetical protein
MGNVGKAVNGVGKILIPPKRTKKAKPSEVKDFLHESSDEYADRLERRKKRGY